MKNIASNKNIKSINSCKVCENNFFTKPDGGQEAIGARTWKKGTQKDELGERGAGNYYYKDTQELKKKLKIVMKINNLKVMKKLTMKKMKIL